MSDDHEPVDHTGGREKPSPTVRWLRCMSCNVRLVPDATETRWVHETPTKCKGPSMTLEPCTNYFGVNSVVAEVCRLCGHNSLVHGGYHNPSLDACVVCSVLAAAVRLEERTSPVIQMNVTKEEKDRVVSGIRHDPKPGSHDNDEFNLGVWWSRCSMCNGLIKIVDGRWVHDPPRWAEAKEHKPLPTCGGPPSATLTWTTCTTCHQTLVRDNCCSPTAWVHLHRPAVKLSDEEKRAKMAMIRPIVWDRFMPPDVLPRCPSVSPEGTALCDLPDLKRDHNGRHRNPNSTLFWPVDGDDLRRWRIREKG